MAFFETVLPDDITAQLLRQNIERVIDLPVYEDPAPDRGAKVIVRHGSANTGLGYTKLHVELDEECTGGLGAMLGIADELAAVFPHGARLAVEHFDNGIRQSLLAYPEEHYFYGSWIRIMIRDEQRPIQEHVLWSPTLTEESPEFQALLDPRVALIGVEYAFDVAHRRMRPDGII